MKAQQRQQVLEKLGVRLKNALSNETSPDYEKLQHCIQQASVFNQWFTIENTKKAIEAISEMLSPESLRSKDITLYNFDTSAPRTVALVMAGNIPLVGFQDLAHVMLSGHNALCKMSSDDDVLLPCIVDMIADIEPRFREKIVFANQHLRDFDAVIATGSNNSARYFNYYFGKYPHIIRKNRNSVAVITGNETPQQLALLASDMFSYFGFGCRNVSALFVPKNYNFSSLIEATAPYSRFADHNKYVNNYEYYRAIHMVNSTPFVDAGFFILIESDIISSPPGILHYSTYNDVKEVENKVSIIEDHLQCVVGIMELGFVDTEFGNTQNPGLYDFADGVDTLEFLSVL
jgi:hypothetical protein